jgi:predicted ester cyclase
MNKFVALMRRYCYDYTNCQNFEACSEVMVPEYTLNMGTFRLSGRDQNYKPATQKQFDQFPGLSLTINRVITNGDRLLMQFSEHGASVKHSGALAAWGGVGLYKWNGEKLTENFVEQDYYARRRQLSSGKPNLVESPAIAPWDTEAEAVNPAAEAFVRQLLSEGDLTAQSGIVFDDAWTDQTLQRVLSPENIEINDFFSAGANVAFHIKQQGRLLEDFCAGDPALEGKAGSQVELHMSGFVTVKDSAIIGGRVIRDRLGLYRRLTR